MIPRRAFVQAGTLVGASVLAAACDRLSRWLPTAPTESPRPSYLLAETGSSVVRDQVTFDGTLGAEPDPSLFTKTTSGSPVIEPRVNEGLKLTDGDNLTSVIYAHPISFAAGDSAQVTCRALTPDVPSNLLTGGLAGTRVILDDGVSRAELALGKDPAGSPIVTVVGSGVTFPFGWNNLRVNEYRLSRAGSGAFHLTVINGADNSVAVDTDVFAGSTGGAAIQAFGSAAPGAATILAVRFEGKVERVGFVLTPTITSLQLKPSGAEKVQVGLDFTLEAASDGIDPAAESVSLQLFNANGALFYPTAFGALINAFAPTPDGWSITDAAKNATGIQAFNIKRTADPRRFQIHYVDTRTGISQDPLYNAITAQLVIGGDSGTSAKVAPRQQANGDWIFP